MRLSAAACARRSHPPSATSRTSLVPQDFCRPNQRLIFTAIGERFWEHLAPTDRVLRDIPRISSHDSPTTSHGAYADGVLR